MCQNQKWHKLMKKIEKSPSKHPLEKLKHPPNTAHTHYRHNIHWSSLSFIHFLFSGHLCQVLTSSDNFFSFKINMSEESLKMEDGEELNLDTTSIENLTDTGECPSLL